MFMVMDLPNPRGKLSVPWEPHHPLMDILCCHKYAQILHCCVAQFWLWSGLHQAT
jgi:hypothetical protein